MSPQLPARAARLGARFLAKLKAINSPRIVEVRRTMRYGVDLGVARIDCAAQIATTFGTLPQRSALEEAPVCTLPDRAICALARAHHEVHPDDDEETRDYAAHEALASLDPMIRSERGRHLLAAGLAPIALVAMLSSAVFAPIIIAAAVASPVVVVVM